MKPEFPFKSLSLSSSPCRLLGGSLSRDSIHMIHMTPVRALSRQSSALLTGLWSLLWVPRSLQADTQETRGKQRESPSSDQWKNITLIILFTNSECFLFCLEHEWCSWARPGAKPWLSQLDIGLRNPQKTMAGGSEDVMHKCTENSQILILIPIGDAVKRQSPVVCVG